MTIDKSHSTIFLVGFMGSGKSTVGQLVASMLHYDFIDTDEEIEKRSGMSISQIFENQGEVYFRKLEHNLLKELCNLKGLVISTGGGMPMYHDNMDIILKNGLSFYMSISLSNIQERLKNDGHRPLFKNASKKELTELYRKRYAIYRRANHSIVANRAPEAIAKRICRLAKI